MAYYTLVSDDEFANIKRLPSPNQTRIFDAIGRNNNGPSDDNFFAKRGRSLENAFGTTGAAIGSFVNDSIENSKIDERNNRFNQSMEDIYKSAGFSNADEYYNAKEAAEKEAFGRIGFDIDGYWDKRADADIAGNQDLVAQLDSTYNEARSKIGNDENLARFDEIQNRLKNQSNQNMGEARKAQQDYADYRNNSYIGQKVNQDRGKFAGSAINTLSTAFDVMAPGAGVLANSVQGGIEGIADELEQNGLENFDLNRAGQNALIGATTGAVTGGLNKGISSQLAKNGGNLFKGGNAITRNLNKLGSSTTAGRIGSTLATGAARGAVSGAVGGATGAGLSAAMNGQDVLGSAIQGAQQGFGQGALAGGVMAGANMAANATPGVGNVMRQLNEAGGNWKNSGDTFNERLTNTLTSGDSPVGEWLQGDTRSRALQRAGMIGNTIADDSNIRLYRGLEQEYDPNYPTNRLDTNGYESWTDNPELARKYGDYVYSIDVPKNDIKYSYLDENPNSPTYGDRNPIYMIDKKAGLDGVSGNEYLLEVGSDYQKGLNYALDNNSPTTLGGWMKQAGKRIIEDANNRGVGMSIKNVADKQTIPQDIQNMRINRPSDTASSDQYRTIPQEEVAMQKKLSPVEAENTLKTSKSEQLRYKAAQELLKQYGTVDKPTAKATNAPKTIQEIADAGFTKPGDVERIADNITGSNGEVNKLVQNLVSTAKRVNTFDGLEGKTIDEFIDESIARNALDGINEGKAVKSQIKAYLNSLESRRSGSVDFSDAPEDVMDVVRGLEAEAANYEGRSGMNYGTTTQDKMNAAKVAKDVATLLKDRVFETVDVKSAMTPEVAQSLKALAPNNKQWSDYVDNKIMTAKNLQDLRSVQAPFVRAKKIIDNGYMNSVTYGGRLGNTVSSIPTTKSGMVRDIVNNTINTNFANRVKAGALNKAADIADRFSGQTAGGGNSGNVNAQTMALPSGEVSGQVSNPSTRIYDMIGRTEGLSNGEQARTADYLINAAQEAEIVPNANAGALESLAQANPMSTSVYDTMSTPTGQMSNSQSGMQSSNSRFPATGDYWTDVLGRAMSAAIDADDVNAFGALYAMYQDSISKLSKTSSGKNYNDITQWNSGDRSKLLSAQNAMDQIDQLENAYNTATGGQGGNFLQGNLRSLAANISGGNLDASANNYNKLAESVGMGIVKNLINLGVTEADAKRYLEYLPALTDTKEQAAQKLETLRNIYQSQINNLYSAYGV